MDTIEKWQQLDVIIMFSVGYICCSYAMLYSAGILHVFFRRQWLLLRLILITAIGVIVDTFALSPVLLFTAADSYLGWWKIISLISVKFSLSVLVVSIAYILITLLNSRLSFKKLRFFAVK